LLSEIGEFGEAIYASEISKNVEASVWHSPTGFWN